MSTSVGLATGSVGTPNPSAMPLTRQVLPAPSGPTRATTSRPMQASPKALPRAWVSAADVVSQATADPTFSAKRAGLVVIELASRLPGFDGWRGESHG